MVRILLLLVLPLVLLGAENPFKVVISSLADEKTERLQGTLIITHHKEDKVDKESFTLEGKPLSLISLGEKEEKGKAISTYQFNLEARPEGLYVLKEIKGKVGDVFYQIRNIAYQVKAPLQKGPPFYLQAAISGKEPVFPGQTLNFVYKVFYLGRFSLLSQNLPLLDPEGFRKVGGIQLKEGRERGYNILEFSQTVIAKTPGKFRLGPSSITGMLDGQQVSAKADILTLEVNALPEKGRPPSFTGAVGDYTFSVELKTNKKQSVQDPLLLHFKIQGGSAANPPLLPNLSCQPGILGFFLIKDTPEAVQLDQGIEYRMEMRAISSQVTEIPPFRFSYFDPKRKEYVTIATAPIPLSLSAAPKEEPLETALPKQLPSREEIPLRPLYILQEKDLAPSLLSGPKSLGLGGLLLFFLLLQYLLKERSEKRAKEKKTLNSQMLLEKLLREAKNVQTALPLIEQTLLVRLQEADLISPTIQDIDQIPRHGALEKIHAFMTEIEEGYYGKEKRGNLPQILNKLKEVLKDV